VLGLEIQTRDLDFQASSVAIICNSIVAPSDERGAEKDLEGRDHDQKAVSLLNVARGSEEE
jgi:hypothetical protein